LEEAGLMGFSGGFDQGKLRAALLELKNFITIKSMPVNPKPSQY